MKVRQTGSTLIEVLITMVVISAGLLGLAGIQATGLRSNQSANLRSQATLLAYDMTDRMRANLQGYDDGDYDKPTGSDESCAWDGSAPAICSAQQMAQHDVWEWRDDPNDAALPRELPQGTGVVCLDSTPDDGGDANGDGTVDITDPAEHACDGLGGLYAVKVWWVDEISADAQGDPVAIMKGFSTEFQP